MFASTPIFHLTTRWQCCIIFLLTEQFICNYSSIIMFYKIILKIIKKIFFWYFVEKRSSLNCPCPKLVNFQHKVSYLQRVHGLRKVYKEHIYSFSYIYIYIYICTTCHEPVIYKCQEYTGSQCNQGSLEVEITSMALSGTKNMWTVNNNRVLVEKRIFDSCGRKFGFQNSWTHQISSSKNWV